MREDPPEQDPSPEPTPAVTPAVPPRAPSGRARDAADRLRRSAGAATGPIVQGMSSAVGAAVGGIRHLPETVRDLPETLRELPGSRVRRVRRLGSVPLPSLYALFPEARRARPVEIGLRTLDVTEIKGTAVGGGDQRGGDFLPLKPFRGPNWRARWQRLRRAQDRLVDLPPIDVVKYDGGYWVIDGHNRVALALYEGQVAVDASVIELVPPGARRTEPIGTLASEVEGSRAVRGRVVGTTAGASSPPSAGPSAPAGLPDPAPQDGS
jgi:hypothetical protein